MSTGAAEQTQQTGPQWCRCDHLDTEHHRGGPDEIQPCTVLVIRYGQAPEWCRCLNFSTAAPRCHACGHKACRHDTYGACVHPRCPCDDYIPVEDQRW